MVYESIRKLLADCNYFKLNNIIQIQIAVDESEVNSVLKPLISVCVASYNNAKYIAATLDSICNQGFRPLEIVIVDDCSKDNSVEVINAWIRKHSLCLLETGCEIKFIAKPENRGVCHTFNQALHNSSGDYISIIGSDDTMLPHKLERLVEFLQAQSDSVGMVFSDSFLINEHGNRLFGRFIQRCLPYISSVPSGDIFNVLAIDNFIPAMATLIKKCVFNDIGLFDEKLNYEDHDYWLRVSRKYQILFFDDVTTEYRIHSSSVTFQKSEYFWVESKIAILIKHADLPNIKIKIRDLIYSYYMNGGDCKELIRKNKFIFENKKSFTYYAIMLNMPVRLWKIISIIRGKNL